ncbi:MAG: ATP-binding protein [Desulfuromonadales bacterium]|nr:ATP-binding protein [Desulfuromonadales bacterium]
MNPEAKELLAAYPLQQLLQTIPTGLFLVDTKMQIVYWNAEAERITGYRAEDAVGQHCSFLEGIPCGNKCGLFEEEKEKPITGVSCTILARAGQRITLSKNIDLLRNAAGEVIGGIEAFVDISRQKQLERSLRQSAVRLRTAVAERTRELEQEKTSLRAVLDGMLDPAYICTGDFRISYINRAMRELLGPVENKPCYAVLHGIDGPCEDCPLPLTAEGETVIQERQMGGRGQTFEIVHSPLPQGSGSPQKLGVCRDISERLETAERLRQANRELDAFVSTVSHDLRSPLTPVIGFAEFLQERYAESLDAVGQECLEEIAKSGKKMLHLLEDLLALARVGQLERPAAAVSTSRVVQEVIQELAVDILKAQGKVIVGELPAVYVPESLLADLVRNLLTNALRYAGDRPQIEIEGSHFGCCSRLVVRDHGPGIPADEREMVFEPFMRGSSAEKISGTGIGLATVRKIVRLYSGQVRIEETPGGGATLVLDFFDPQ